MEIQYWCHIWCLIAWWIVCFTSKIYFRFLKIDTSKYIIGRENNVLSFLVVFQNFSCSNIWQGFPSHLRHVGKHIIVLTLLSWVLQRLEIWQQNLPRAIVTVQIESGNCSRSRSRLIKCRSDVELIQFSAVFCQCSYLHTLHEHRVRCRVTAWWTVYMGGSVIPQPITNFTLFGLWTIFLW